MTRRLRVAVACDAIGPLDSQAAGVAVARGWADDGQVAVVPLADAGPPLGAALGHLLDAEPVVEGDFWWLAAAGTLAVGARSPETAPVPGWDPAGSSSALGAWLDECLGRGPTPQRLVIDLTGTAALDGGAGLLGAVGATATGDLAGGLAGLPALDRLSLGPVRSRLPGTEVVGVVSPSETGLGLLGLQGAVARRGYQERLDPADLLAAESTMTRWLGTLGLADGPGAGASGGAGAAVLALGGRVVRGAALCAELAGLERTAALADVVVTGCTSFHIGNWGGEVVRYVADLAGAAETPCLVFAVESTVSRREMRTFGVEAAHAIGIGPLPDALTTASVRVARSWTALSEPRVD